MEHIINRDHQYLAGELHDGIAQQITYVLHKIEYIQRLWGINCPEAMQAELQFISNTLEESLDEVRKMISALLQQTTQESPISYSSLRPEGCGWPVTPIVQCIQEALVNIWKHAHATEVDIHLHSSDNWLTVEVKDNGSGFQPEQFHTNEGQTALTNHFGLALLQSRIKDVGGLWELQSRPNEGTTVRAHFPLT